MKQYLLFLVLAVNAFAGCIGTKRYATHVTKAYHSFDTSAPVPVKDVRFVYNGPTVQPPLVQVRKGQTYFIPAIVYWGTKETFNCELNADVSMSIMQKAFNRASAEERLARKLKGRKLEINVASMPRRFTYTNQYDLIFLLFFYFQTTIQNVSPQPDNLTFTYKVYDGSETVREGTIDIRNYDSPYTDNIRSSKKITKAYYAQYRKNLEDLAAESLDKLVSEL